MIGLLAKAKNRPLEGEKLKQWLFDNSEDFTIEEMSHRHNMSDTFLRAKLIGWGLKYKVVHAQKVQAKKSKQNPPIAEDVLVKIDNDRRKGMTITAIAKKYDVKRGRLQYRFSMKDIYPACSHCGQ